ncbi:MAG: pyruvate ferredoxin oxidoreductase [Deltaproteobacteria bacterium]|jgi:2-oxoacid:acceptor oxidoreductase gamma subunit (pyruvate/2-ketoisovalerate family)|nr:pyruvate ferredoxin oxidoreductase [Deltaproteobacteria bacterium]
MIEISFSGRGGQGVVMASQILGLAFFKAGNYPQCYSVFGGERRGAPLASFLRVDDRKILLKCEIKYPNEFLCFDDTLFDLQEVRSQLVPGGNILINTRKSPEAFSDLAKDFKVGIIDGLAVSREIGLGNFFNTIMVGAYGGFTGHIGKDPIVAAIMEMAPTEPELNARGALAAFERVTILESTNGTGGAHG